MNNVIPIEIFESLEICAYIHRFLFEFNKYIHKRSPSLNVYIPYHTINIYVSDELAAWQILLMTTGKKQKKQQSTMSEITHQMMTMVMTNLTTVMIVVLPAKTG